MRQNSFVLKRTLVWKVFNILGNSVLGIEGLVRALGLVAVSPQGHCAQVWDQGSCTNTRCDISALPIGFLVAGKSRAEPNWDLMLVLRELVGQRCRAELRSAGPYGWDGMEWDGSVLMIRMMKPSRLMGWSVGEFRLISSNCILPVVCCFYS